MLHLIFGEMMSSGAITSELPGGDEMRQSFQAFAHKHSLRLFDAVYSRYYLSGESLPNLFGPEYRGRTNHADVFTEPRQPGEDNAYFDDLAAQGYGTAVFQTSHMDFCRSKQVDLCDTFDSFDPAGAGADGPHATPVTASLWRTLFRAYEPSYVSAAGRYLADKSDRLESAEARLLGVAGRYDAQGFPDWFDRFASFVSGVPRGTHVFAHFLVPQAPYFLTERCLVSGRFDAGYYLGARYPGEQDQKRREYYGLYLPQLRCVQQKLDELLLTLQARPDFHDATIIIHGDHGSRISVGNVKEDYRPRDFSDNYATFFAVKSPGVPSGIDCEFLALPQAFRRYSSRHQVSADQSRPLTLLATSRAAGNQKVEVGMPRFGCAAPAP